ncbi:MAG: hypothetical protein ICV54_16750 [Nostoc sp. C3-bin3]|nr:hypothetical protein [Nostoc sp. C3-bin3]
MTGTRFYILTVTSPDGSSTDITLFGVRTEKTAKIWVTKYRKLYPDCKVEIL